MVESINSTYSANSMSYLENRLQDVKDEQGFIGNIWNDIKEAANLGQSESDCDSMLEQYKRGSVSFEEAVEYINNFEAKQKDMTNLFSNITTGIAAIALATTASSCAPIGWGLAIAKGAPIGAAFKTAIKTLDRATNNVEDDELDFKLMLKDAISGAATGATSAVSSNIGAGIKTANLGLTLLNGTKCGAVCGAGAAALNYVSDAIIDNKEFSFGDLTKNTLTSAFVSGTVGAVVGGGVYGAQSLAGNVGQEVTKSTARTIIGDSTTSSIRKALAQGERNLLSA